MSDEVKPDGWTKCSERLPEAGVWVLVFTPDDADRPIKDLQFVYEDPEDGQCWLTGERVTHWRPLPAKPKGEA